MHRSIPRQGSAHDADHGKGERTPEVGTPFDPRRGSRLMRGHRVWAAKAIEGGESNATAPRQGSACLCAEDGRGRSGREMRDEVKHDLAVAPATPAATRKTAHGAFPGARCRTSSASGVMQAWDFLLPRGSAAHSCSPKSQLRDGTRRMSHTNAQGESHVKSHVKASSGESTQGLANALGRFGIAFAALVTSLACAGIGASPASADACPNEAIRAAQKSSFLHDGSIHLPDCMALEMVSTPKKENQYATIPEVSADGERIRYASGGALGDTPNFLSAFFNRYVASRGDSGWATVAATPVDPEMGLGNGSIFSPDFSSWFHFASTSPQASLGIGRIYRSGIDHRFEPLSPLLVAIDGGTHFRENLTGATPGGAAPAPPWAPPPPITPTSTSSPAATEVTSGWPTSPATPNRPAPTPSPTPTWPCSTPAASPRSSYLPATPRATAGAATAAPTSAPPGSFPSETKAPSHPTAPAPTSPPDRASRRAAPATAPPTSCAS